MDLFSYLLGRKSGGGGGSPGGGGGSENLAKAIIERSATEISDSTVTSIGNYAFRECKELTSAVFPNVTSIGDYAFNGCKKFTNMNLSKVNSYGDYALGGCTAFVIENLTFPIGTTIGQYAFNQVPIKGADLTNVSSIGKRAFSGSGLEYVYFPGHITPADGVLAGCSSLIAVDFADEITTIPYQCFSQSKNLERVHLPSELKTIEAYAFERCEKLVITEIPSKVTTIAHDAFATSPSAQGTLITVRLVTTP